VATQSPDAGDWRETFEVGASILDRQHQELLLQIVQLADALRDDRDPEHQAACINFLDALVAGHLETEATLMETLHYPDSAHLKSQHTELVSAFHHLRDALNLKRSGDSPDLVDELNRSVYGWLFKHVTHTDRTFSAFLRAQSVARTGT
jgi:hemerythrin-like metal-binding protein